jgi:hypothetical protein
VAWRKENFIRKDCARNQAEQGTPKPQKDRKRQWKGQEFNDGLREGLKQQQRGKSRLKESGTKRQLRLGNKKTFRLHNSETGRRISCCVTKNAEWEASTPSVVGIQNPDIVEESATSKQEKALTRGFGVRGAGNVGAPATPGITAPTVVCERERRIFE